MLDFLYSIDKNLFYLFNQALHNPLFDVIMPFITNMDQIRLMGIKIFYVIGFLLWIILIAKGGKTGRVVALLFIPTIIVSDQLSSHLIKPLVERPRPCHVVNGSPVLEHIRLLVDCGSGKSFPSSHAVNSFAGATLLSFYYRQWSWIFLAYASVVSFSRVYVGVHYPLDVVGGAVVGTGCALFIIFLWQKVEKYFQDRKTVRDTSVSK